ncbi:MAG: flagellar biosynthetic protein FliO [Comamonadaceae bacterium]|nr:flagellar biosynthetic protein FliO [Burkholderiales bacterium]MEB2348484.1 flagellar biosynthetic protein FliO [Comamonadaceae bacterium]
MSAAASTGFTQSLAWVVLFVVVIAALPWLVRRWQHQRSGVPRAAGAGSRVLASVAVGPQQRVVTVETGTSAQRVVLVLGVTAQQVSCLHVLAGASFADEVAAAHTASGHD